jgi:hypothetical protein
MVTHLLAVSTIFSLLFSGGAGGCRTNHGAKSQSNKSQTSQNEKENQPDQKARPSASEFKVVAAGFHSSVGKPFIAIIRDGATFSELAKLEPTLRNLETDFKTNILIAAFLGERNTGGYGVEISRSQTGEIQIREKKPGKDAMVPQMITSPFKVGSIQSSTAVPVRIEFDAAWSAGMDNYTVTKGTFTVSGGFAGRSEQFELVGGVRLMQQKQLVSFGFILRKKAESDKVVLEDFATGTIESGAVKVAVLSAGDLIPPPTNGLGASGSLTNRRQNLSLTFISLPTMIADGYGGGGMIEAVKVIPTAENASVP